MSHAKSESRLGTEPIGSLVFKLAIPAVTAQLVNTLYNIVDRIYIGHIEDVGAIALTGLGVTAPIISFIAAFSAFVGMAGAPLAAIELGRKNKDKAERFLGNGVTSIFAMAIVLTVFFYIFKEPLLYKFGASDATIKYAVDYLNVYLIGTIFVQISLGLNMFISCQGRADIAMWSVVIGAVVNIILDPIFIFVFNLGVVGAGLATVIAQACSAVWIFKFLLSKKSSIKIKKKNLKIEWALIASIIALGVSPFIMYSTESLVFIVLNSGLQSYGGDKYVGTMTVLQSVMMIVQVPMMGLSQGTQPLLSYNYGAKKPDRVIKAFKYTFITELCISIFFFVVCQLFPQQLGSLFIKDAETLDIIKYAMPVFMGGCFIFAMQTSCQMAFLGLGKAKISLFLALLRKVILLVPLVLVLPVKMGVMGIFYAEPIADIIAGLTTGTSFFILFRAEMKRMKLENLNAEKLQNEQSEVTA